MAGPQNSWGELSSQTLRHFLEESVLIPRLEISRVLLEQVVPEVERILQGVREADPRFGSAFQRSGSYIEGLKVSEPDEFDFLVPLLKFPQLYHSDQVVYMPEARENPSFVPVILSNVGQKKSTEPGEDMSLWRKLDVSERVHPCVLPDAAYSAEYSVRNVYTPPNHAHSNCANTGVIPAQVMSIFKKQVCDVISRNPGKVKVKRMQQNSPAVTLTIPWKTMEISVDLVPFIKNPFNEWSWNWPREMKLWPSASKIAEVKDTGVDLVAKHHLYWRYSFSRIERVLLENIDADGGQRRNSLRILKKVREDLWKPKFPKNALVSYHLKTVLFWSCECYPHEGEWCDLAVSFKRLVDQLILYLDRKELPHFILGKSVNLFNVEDRVLEAVLWEVVQFKATHMKYFQ